MRLYPRDRTPRLLTLQTVHIEESFGAKNAHILGQDALTPSGHVDTFALNLDPFQTFNRLKSLSQHVQTTSVDKLYDFKPGNPDMVNKMWAI